MGYEMRQMQAFRWKGQILENRCYLEVQVSYIMGIFEAGFKGQVLPGGGAGERKQVIPIGADEGNRCGGEGLPTGHRYKETNVTWRSKCGELKGEHRCDRCVDRQVWVKSVT